MHTNKKLSKAEKDDLRTQKTVINGVFVALKKRLMILQHEISYLTGRPLQAENLNVSKINEKTAKIEKIIAKGRILKFIMVVVLFKGSIFNLFQLKNGKFIP